MIQSPSEDNKIEYVSWRKETHRVLGQEKRNNMKKKKITDRKIRKKFFEISKQIKIKYKLQVKIFQNEKIELIT